MVYLLVMLYWPMGSASAPDMAGPTMYPIPHAAPTMVMPSAWLVSSEASDMTALQAVIKPGEKIHSDENNYVVTLFGFLNWYYFSSSSFKTNGGC